MTKIMFLNYDSLDVILFMFQCVLYTDINNVSFIITEIIRREHLNVNIKQKSFALTSNQILTKQRWTLGLAAATLWFLSGTAGTRVGWLIWDQLGFEVPPQLFSLATAASIYGLLLVTDLWSGKPEHLNRPEALRTPRADQQQTDWTQKWSPSN